MNFGIRLTLILSNEKKSDQLYSRQRYTGYGSSIVTWKQREREEEEKENFRSQMCSKTKGTLANNFVAFTEKKLNNGKHFSVVRSLMLTFEQQKLCAYGKKETIWVDAAR